MTSMGTVSLSTSTNAWEQVDIFPAIARIITASFQASGDFVTHDAIVAELLTDYGR